jgi:OPA family glycerol-3-phosphate transporter-like MFS transporter
MKDMRRLRRQQTLVVTLLFAGYGSLYFCRSDLSAATPLLIDELVSHGFSHAEAVVRLGAIPSLGVFAYAMGKLFLGGLGDYWGGRASFLVGLGGATLFTVLFTMSGGLPIFTVAWIGNRLTQSVAWAGLVKVSSKWFDYSSYGLIIGILSVSYLVGDAAARAWMGSLLRGGSGWRSLFYLAAAAAGVSFLLCLFLLRESRTQAGHTEAKVNPLNLYADEEGKDSWRAYLLPLVRSPAFLLVCLLSLGCTIIRETFNFWTPVYLRDSLGYNVADAATMSAIFPAVGAVSVILVGYISDRLGPNGRSLPLFLGLFFGALALAVLTLLHAAPGHDLPALIAIAAVAFFILGPYSFLGGAFALDFGGKRAGALASGLIDGVGYLGGVMAGDTVARVSVSFGWKGVFLGLAAVCAIAAAGALQLHRMGSRSLSKKQLS